MPELHLLRLGIDPAGLERLARARRIGAEDDAGYRLHVLLTGLLGEDAPAPWFLDPEPRGRLRTLWAYSPFAWEALAERIAGRLAGPAAAKLDEDLVSWLRGALAWEACAGKALPALAAGTTLRVDARLCATQRLHRALPGIAERPRTDDHPGHGPVAGRGAGDEVDALIAEALRRTAAGTPCHPRDLAPEAIYRPWAEAALVRTGGCRIDRLALNGYRAVRVLRRRHGGGERHPLTLPEVQVEATVTVTDAEAFAAGLARGIGRHRAFGFGMARLRPAAPPG